MFKLVIERNHGDSATVGALYENRTLVTVYERPTLHDVLKAALNDAEGMNGTVDVLVFE